MLLDPYAKAIARDCVWDDAVLDPERDTAAFAPLARVVDTAFPGMTTGRCARHGTRRSSMNCTSRDSRNSIRSVPEKLRGTYAGLASAAAIEHFRKLGVTAVELLPVHYHIDEHFLVDARPLELLGLQHARFLRA